MVRTELRSNNLRLTTARTGIDMLDYLGHCNLLIGRHINLLAG